MNQEKLAGHERFRPMVEAVENRVVSIAGAKVRPRVLSIHPSLVGLDFEENLEREVTLRLDLRPIDAPTTGAAIDGTFEARLCKIGFTFPFRMDEQLDGEVGRLVNAIEEEVPHALQRSESPRVLIVHPVPPAAKLCSATAAMIVAGLISLLLYVWGLGNVLTGLGAALGALCFYEFSPHVIGVIGDRISARQQAEHDGERAYVWFAIFATLVFVVGGFLAAAATIANPPWVAPLLSVAAVVFVAFFLQYAMDISGLFRAFLHSSNFAQWESKRKELFAGFKAENDAEVAAP